MDVFRAEDGVYYVRWRGIWWEAVRGEGISLVEPEEENLKEYMEYVLADAEEVTPGDTPFWVVNYLSEVR